MYVSFITYVYELESFYLRFVRWYVEHNWSFLCFMNDLIFHGQTMHNGLFKILNKNLIVSVLNNSKGLVMLHVLSTNHVFSKTFY
jgi:hypothetical protein